MSNLPSSLNYIQQESLQFRRPVSESALQAIGSTINGLLDDKSNQETRFTTDEALIASNFTTLDNEISNNVAILNTTITNNYNTLNTAISNEAGTRASQIQLVINALYPVGTIIASMLDATTFASHILVGGFNNQTWILADGRSVAGLAYQTLTGNSHAPDLRGQFLRGKDYGAGIDTAHGDQVVGSAFHDMLTNHAHSVTSATTSTSITSPSPAYVGHDTVTQTNAPDPFGVNLVADGSIPTIVSSTSVTIGNPTSVAGVTLLGLEITPKYTVINYFIRID